MNSDEIFETRLLTPAELAELVKAMRDKNKWSQVTLAEIARVDERTIQRVENGEQSSFDTRRALAGAFRFVDLDVFNEPRPIPNIEKLKTYWAELEKTTVIIPITRIRDARTLRTMSEGVKNFAVEDFGELSAEAREAFASIVDYLRDYTDVCDHFSMTQCLDLDRAIDALLKTIADAGAAIGAGLQRARVRFKSDAPNLEPANWTNIRIVLAPNDALPVKVRVSKDSLTEPAFWEIACP